MIAERKTLKPFILKRFSNGEQTILTPDGKPLPYVQSIDIVGCGEYTLAVVKALWFAGDEYDILKPYSVDNKLLHYDGESYAIIQSGIDVSAMTYNIRLQYTFVLVPLIIEDAT